jgi:hypothetical protein
MKNETSALIIGNGTTRRAFKIDKMAEHYTTFGCNALYRDFQPDYLVSLDNGMIREILAAKVKSELFVPDEDDQYEPAAWNPNRPRENAGMVAMRLAIEKGFTTLYCVGMDFLIDNYEINLSNVYANTPNYSANTAASYQDNVNRANYFAWFTRRNPQVEFVLLFPDGLYNFRGIEAYQNVKRANLSKEFLA